MKKTAVAILASSLFSTAAVAAQYEVSITNLTLGQTFTPILVASHYPGVEELFELGQPASAELAALAEGGDISLLRQKLVDSGRLIDSDDSGGLLGPGETVMVRVKAPNHRRAEISLAAMLIPTNDGFFALNGVHAPSFNKSLTYFSPVYDAGSELNDEDCANIPGPVCGGEGGSPLVGGEGYVHIHGGIHGIKDLAAATYDWRNPAAKITIKRVKE